MMHLSVELFITAVMNGRAGFADSGRTGLKKEITKA